MATIEEITEPILTIQHSLHVATNVYLLVDSEQGFRKPKGRGKSFLVGPAFIVERTTPDERKVSRYPLNGSGIWDLFNGYIQAGAWALNDTHAAAAMPSRIREASQRFAHMSQEQLKSKAARTKKRGKS